MLPGARCARVPHRDRSSDVKGSIYKGYVAAVEFDPEDAVFAGRLVGIKDVVGFHA